MIRPPVQPTRSERRWGAVAATMVLVGIAVIVFEVGVAAAASSERVAIAQLTCVAGVVVGGSIAVRVFGLDTDDDADDPHEPSCDRS